MVNTAAALLPHAIADGIRNTAEPARGHTPLKVSSAWMSSSDQKKISYRMHILQQPKCARAKAVLDPPFVVKLQLLELEHNNGRYRDVTSTYNAKFFLHASLERAQPSAHRRLSVPSASPALVGDRVAEIVHIERPTQAGYFVFSDLTVPHEGRYVLKFYLYEQSQGLKSRRRGPVTFASVSMDYKDQNALGAPQYPLHFRLKVKSEPFNIIGSKAPHSGSHKSLRRMVIEQGRRCRVRREVRMRRRQDESREQVCLDEGTRHERYEQESDLNCTRREMDRAVPCNLGNTINMSYRYNLGGPHLPRLSHSSLMKPFVSSEHEVFPRLHLHTNSNECTKFSSLPSTEVIQNVTPAQADYSAQASWTILVRGPPKAVPLDMNSLGYDQITNRRCVYSGERSSMSKEMGGPSHRLVSPARNGEEATHGCHSASQPCDAETHTMTVEMGGKLAYKRADGKIVTKMPPGTCCRGF